MARRTHTLVCLVVLLAVTSSEKLQSRWSRQISSYTADISDWVPLPGPVQREPPKPKINTPIKRQAIAEPRILTEPFPGFARPTGFGQDTFPSRTYFNSPANKQLYLQSVPSAPQNFLNDQGFGQSIRFGLSQPNYPLNQGFAAPQYTFESPGVKARPIQPSNPIKFDTYPKQSIAPISQTKPFVNPVGKIRPEEPKFIDDSNSKKKAQSLQKLKFEEKYPKAEPIPPKPKAQKEEVQLLYVPLESLNRGQFNFRGPIAAPQIVGTDLYSQGLPKIEPLKQPFTSDFQRPLPKPVENFGSGQDYFGSFMDSLKDYDQVPKFSTVTSPFATAPPTTPRPKKLKPHQPPLAIFQEAKNNGQAKVGDVLFTLKNANTIAVLDTVNPLNSPKVFIGPSSLTPPEGFVKFELPYLSNIENSDKKLRQLPFFVAPLSYNTPNGFAKIPFPSPHVGSVVINGLIRENPSQPSYPTPPAFMPPSANIAYKETTQTQKPVTPKPVTPKPSFNYYSTSSPKTNAPLNQQSTYYSFEPQTVTSLSPQTGRAPLSPSPQKGNYFISNVNGDVYNPSQYANFNPQEDYKDKEQVNPYTVPKPETTTTLRTTTTTTTPKPSTYSSQLLETHNPYSINQAFHFSTPLDYHNYFDEFKETYAPPGVNLEVPKPTSTVPKPTPTPTKQQEIETERPRQQTSPNYAQNYSPEIQYHTEVTGAQYPVYNTNDYPSKTETNSVPSQYQQTTKSLSTENYNDNIQPQANYDNLTETIINKITGPSSDIDNSNLYEQYDTNYSSNERTSSTTATSTTTTTTTRRSPIRSRGRPRYTTAKPDSNESTTKTTYTRKPLRDRRPLPSRSRYEPNKISTDKTTKKSVDSNESTTKTSRTRTRGRVQYKPSDNDEYYDKRNKGNSKEEDLAYQRDILHQNYPVTLMERTSTVDIEAITEPSPRISSTKTLETAISYDTFDTENAYAHESAAISHLGNSNLKDDIPTYTSRVETQYEDIAIPKYSTRNEEYYSSKNSAVPTQSLATHEESMEKQEDFPRHTTPVQRIEKPSVSSYATESFSINTEQPNYSINNEQNSKKDVTTSQDTDVPKVESHESTIDEQPEENVVQTTPSYNRVRVRPGVIRQYHQASSTDSSRTKTDRRRPVQAITYRPAFDKRRTTMRIDEIEADLKTKQVHSRPEVQDYRHPVYKPEPSIEGSTASTLIETTKRGQFRRRRPTYTTTSTEAVSTKKIYEVKNRFRGRRPTTEKPSNEKLDVQGESTSTTVRNTPYSRYNHRPRLSERYNKKPEPEGQDSEDQESNYSINRPKYVAPESDQWSPKITSESFKPFNPNDILDDSKSATTERRSDKIEDRGELDIITARNDYDDILISVTPATNNRGVKKMPDIPPTLEALVEQSKTTNSDSTDNMSTFETMLEEVMKSLEEQDKDEYTSNVMKHKGGEIGEIPPEKIITSGDDYAAKSTTPLQLEATTIEPTAEVADDSKIIEEQQQQKGHTNRRRGFWKKVKVRPVNTESIEVAESQYYSNTVNRLGESVKNVIHDKSEKQDKPRVTTYKPNFQFIQNNYDSEDLTSPDTDEILDMDITKLPKNPHSETTPNEEQQKKTTPIIDEVTTVKLASLGEEDLGTGSPDPTSIDNMYYSSPTEPTASEGVFGMLQKADSFSLMDYLFGTTSSEGISQTDSKNKTVSNESKKTTVIDNIDVTTEQPKPKIVTTESSYIPEEITTVPLEENNTDGAIEFEDIKKIFEEKPKEIVTETPAAKVTSESSFMNPSNVVSTSMSTEVSHETEICFRGKCIKTSKDIL
ncbi:mucin-5AC [Plodia interpunctella]|uniref:mucin-5AC n=1 Tax=Plodia interpunctella TaxID=58824 RepID=UPI002367DE2C|nr:mucin-5AC [Plodia interpunctella]XP_053620065.1 mucin-5AC [Plodia interpunctella]